MGPVTCTVNVKRIGIARIISWGGHRFSPPLGALSSFLAPNCLNFSDEDSTLTFFFSTSLCIDFNHLYTNIRNEDGINR